LLDLLDGDAISGGGVSRHSFELQGGAFYNGMGLRFRGTYGGKSRIDGSGLPGSTDLYFDDIFKLDLRIFADLGRKEKLVAAVPFLEGTRVSLAVDNVFDARQRVTDSTGTVPLRYQPFLIDPIGRKFEIEFRKLF
jgi:iron complex outermembrane receptor protein